MFMTKVTKFRFCRGLCLQGEPLFRCVPSVWALCNLYNWEDCTNSQKLFLHIFLSFENLSKHCRNSKDGYKIYSYFKTGTWLAFISYIFESMPIYWGVTHILIKLKCVDQYQIFQYCLPVHQYQRGMFAFPSFHNFSLKKIFFLLPSVIFLSKKVGWLESFSLHNE